MASIIPQSTTFTTTALHLPPNPITHSFPKSPQNPAKPPPKTPHNSVYFNFLAQSVRDNDIYLAKAAHASILKHEHEHDNNYLQNSLVATYFKLGQTHLAEKVFYGIESPSLVLFSSMISGFAKSNREDDAIKIFFEMRDAGIEPNEYTYVALLTACMRLCNSELGFQVHSLVIKFGCLDNSYVVNSLMGVYGRCGLLSFVFQLFDEMPQRDVASWNTVINLLVRELMYERAFGLFTEMLGVEGLSIDHFSISSLLAASTACRGLMEGLGIHGHAVKAEVETDLSVSNALIGFHTEKGSVKDVEGLFERMTMKDVISWNQMITSYMKFGLVDRAMEVFESMPVKNCVSYNSLLAGFCQNGIGLRPLRLFCRMVEEGKELDNFSLTSVVNACGLHRDKKTSEQIHGFVLKFGLGSNYHVESALIDMCTKCGKIADAEKMFRLQALNVESALIDMSTKCGRIFDAKKIFRLQTLKKDRSITWTSLICGYARNGQPHEAISLFLQGQSEETIIVDEITLTTVLGVCGTLGIHMLGEQIHCCTLKKGFQSDLWVENALISMYSKCGNMKAAIKVFNMMSRRDIVSYNCLMAGYILHRQGDEALKLWAEIEKVSLRPDSITTLLTVSAYTHTSLNLVDDCRSFFYTLRNRYGIKPISEHYASFVRVLGKWGHLEEAEQIITSMPFEPDPSVWRALLDSCRIQMNTTIGKRAAKQILSRDPQDMATYILASNLYSASGRWQNSEMTREEMREKGIQKRPAQSWIIHENKVHSFFARDKLHSKCKDIYSGLDILVLECLKAGYVPDTSFVLHEVEEYQKKDFLFYHSAKLAVTYGLLTIKPGIPICVMKNIVLCGDCHTFFKHVSVITKREIHVRDSSGFHYFSNGQCSCKGYWI